MLVELLWTVQRISLEVCQVLSTNTRVSQNEEGIDLMEGWGDKIIPQETHSDSVFLFMP